MWGFLRKYSSEHGASMVEYSLVAALLAGVSIAALGFTGEEANDAFCIVGANMEQIHVGNHLGASAQRGCDQ